MKTRDETGLGQGYLAKIFIFFDFFFEIYGKVFASFWRKIFFKPKFFWRRRAGLGPGGPKTCLFQVFETYGFLPGGLLDGSEFCTF